MRSCLRMRFAPSISFLTAISTSSPTWRFFNSDKCIDGSLGVVPSGDEDSDRGVGAAGIGSGSTRARTLAAGEASDLFRERLAGSDIAVNERGELRLGYRAHLGSFGVAVLEQ